MLFRSATWPLTSLHSCFGPQRQVLVSTLYQLPGILVNSAVTTEILTLAGCPVCIFGVHSTHLHPSLRHRHPGNKDLICIRSKVIRGSCLVREFGRFNDRDLMPFLHQGRRSCKPTNISTDNYNTSMYLHDICVLDVCSGTNSN